MANVPKSAMRDRESGIGTKRVRKNPNPTPPGHGLADSLLQLTGQVMGLAGAAVNGSVAAATSLLPIGAKATRTLLKAGGLLRQMREAAGLSLDDVSSAVDLRDPELLALAEHGKMALPFELILRLAAVLARNDPVPFVMNLTKVYSPTLWTALDSLGIGRLVEQVGREHDFVGIYRARDKARHLNEEEFRRICRFVEAAFDLALELTVQPPPADAKPPRRRTGNSSRAT